MLEIKRILICFIFCGGVLSEKAPVRKLNDGRDIPILALGTYGTQQDIDSMRQAINWAVEAGYRHIDTASLYRNEEQIGKGIDDVISRGLVKREDLFVTTKLWNDRHSRDQVVPALKESLQRLGLSYVDLYLIHSPIAQNDDGSVSNVDYLQTWRGMEDAQKLGLTKSIGVSNFEREQIDRILASGLPTPAVNQIESVDIALLYGTADIFFAIRDGSIMKGFQCNGPIPGFNRTHPTLTQEPLVDYCKNLSIAVMGYSPFGFLVSRKSPNALPPRADDPELTKMAQKYGKTTTQIVLRYLIDRDIIPVPKSTNKERLKQNINVFDFQLTPDEVQTINNFNKDTGIFDV